ncbi:MAG TPA: S8 family serine peptidase [Kribbellaceae bacterium]|jgi:subtilisin family serine protease/LAS superfamily LD-carboxypeptidase LdcB
MDPALAELLRDTLVPGSIEAIIRLDAPDTRVPGVRMVARFGRIATCRVQRDAVAAVRRHAGVHSLKAARLVGRQDGWTPLPGRGGVGLSPADGDTRRPAGLRPTGAGIVIGIADWGFDVDHPALCNPDGSTRVLALWDQRPGRGEAPWPYGYGTVHSRAEIDEALATGRPYAHLGYHPADADRGGGAHGTHVADIAAGSGGAYGPAGVAPKAHLVLVHLADRGTGGLANLGDSCRLLEAVKFIERTAGDLPFVINLSVGRMGGPHDRTTLVEQALDELLAGRPGCSAVLSGGNYHRSRTHAAGRLAAGERRSLSVLVPPADLSTNELEIWYSGADELAVHINSPGGASVSAPLGEQADIVEDGELVGRIYHRAHDPNNGDHHVDAFLYPQARAGRWTVTVEAVRTMSTPFHAWIERDECGWCQARFAPADADPAYTTGTIANGTLPLVVGAFDARRPGRPLATFSSCGPTRDGRTKPDLCAPGKGVLAARSAPADHDRSPGAVVRKSGTSMAAPHVTGAVALSLQLGGHRLDARRIRDLVLGSVSPPSRAVLRNDDPRRIGRGHLDIPALVAATQRALAVRPAGPPSKEAMMNRDLDPVPPLTLAPARAYRELVYRGDGDIGQWLSSRFEIIGRPGGRLRGPLEQGDIVLQAVLGDDDRGSCSVLTVPGLSRWRDGEPGWYALAQGSRPVRVLTPARSVPHGLVLLRPRDVDSSSADAADEAGDGGPWTGSAGQLEFRDRVLAAHLARSGRNGRRPPQRDLRPDELDCVPGTVVTRNGRTRCVQTASETTAAVGRLLAAANADLAAAQRAGDEDALRTVRVTAVSGYRSSAEQRRLWLGYFAGDKGYYNRTRKARAALPDGPHSDQAVRYMLDADSGFGLGARIAAPGYSNHQGGIAVDLWQERTAGNAVANSSTAAARKLWRDTWLHRWLTEHAAEHRFKQLASEEWHYEYQSGGSAGAASTGVTTRADDTAVADHLGGRLWTFHSAGSGLRVAVFCPRAALRSDRVDVLLFAHGLLDGCPRPRQLPAGFVTDPPFRLGSLVDACGRAVVLAVPLLDWSHPGGSDAFGPQHPRWHALAALGTLERLLGEVLAEVGRVRSTAAPALRQLVVAGHSRAYDVLEPLAHQRHEPALAAGHLARLAQVWAFDTTYGGQVDGWVDWLARNPRLHVQVFYRPGTRTATVGERFYRRRGDRLTVTPVDESHCAVPVRRLPALLATLATAETDTAEIDTAEIDTAEIDTECANCADCAAVAVVARADELVAEEGWIEQPDATSAPDGEGEEFIGDIIRTMLRSPTIGFEFDVHYGVMAQLLPVGAAMPADGAAVSDHTWAADGFLVKRDGPRLEINTKPFEATKAGRAELRQTIARIRTFAGELADGCAHASPVTVPGLTGQARPFHHPRIPTVPIVKLPVSGGFTNCSVWAAPQATLTIPLAKVRTLVQRIKASEGTGPGKALSGGSSARMGLRSEALYRAAAEVGRARRRLTFSDDLDGFLILLASYLWTSELTYRFPTPDAPARPGEDYEPFGKSYLPINVKTPFSQVFATLLSSADEQAFRTQFADGAARVNLFRLARPSGATLADGARRLLPTGPMDGGRPSVHDNQEAEFGVVPTWNDLVEHALDPRHRGWGDRLLVPLSKPIDVAKTRPRVAMELRRIGWASVDRSLWPDLMTGLVDLTEELSR